MDISCWHIGNFTFIRFLTKWKPTWSLRLLEYNITQSHICKTQFFLNRMNLILTMLYDITSWSSLFIINNKAVFNRLTDSLCYTDVTILEIKYIPYNFMFYLKPEKEHYLRKKITFINLFKILMQRINTIGRASYCGVGKLYYAI